MWASPTLGGFYLVWYYWKEMYLHSKCMANRQTCLYYYTFNLVVTSCKPGKRYHFNWIQWFYRSVKTPQIVWMFRTRLYGGETPQTPLSVFYVGFAHVRGRPPKTPQIVWLFRTRLYGGETPLSVFYVGFAHVRERPPKTPQIVWLFEARLYGGGNPPNPPKCVLCGLRPR